MNLVLEKKERVTMGGKSRGEIRGETGRVSQMVTDGPTTYSLGKRYGVGKVEVLLVVGGLDVDRGVEAKLVNIKEGGQLSEISQSVRNS